jgi:hypothetical protein
MRGRRRVDTVWSNTARVHFVDERTLQNRGVCAGQRRNRCRDGGLARRCTFRLRGGRALLVLGSGHAGSRRFGVYLLGREREPAHQCGQHER